MRPSILFVHGMWSQPWVWDNWKKRFEARGYACIALTLPAHAEGAADSDLEHMGMADYTAAVEQIARQHDRPVLIGHSLGGLIVQQVAMRLRLSAAVLVNSAVPAPIFPQRPIMLPGLMRHFMRWRLWRKSFRLSRWEANHLLFNAMAKSEQDACYRRLTAESGRIAYQLGFGRLNLAGSNRVDRAAIGCPLLALSGSRDHIIPAAASRRMAAWYGAQLDYREHAGHAHWMLGEVGWELRADEVLDWLQQGFPGTECDANTTQTNPSIQHIMSPELAAGHNNISRQKAGNG